MKPQLSAEDYLSSERFNEEQSTIFQCWQFAGYIDDLANADDWITVKIRGLSYIIQNCAGTLKAFLNVCSHRYSQLRSAERGHGRIQCPYHGWCYDDDGVPCAIPHKPRFDDLTPERVRGLALQSFPVATWGKLVFLRPSPNGSSFHDYIMPIRERLDPMIHAIGDKIDMIEVRIKANWKLVLENTLEGYHIHYVHRDTFDRLGLADTEMEFYGPHSIGHTPVDENAKASWCRMAKHLQSRSWQIDAYDHVLLFPNLAIGSLYGATFAIQQFIPLAPGETLLKIDMFGCRYDSASGCDPFLIKAFFQNSIEFSRKVIEEDQQIVELQQLGVSMQPMTAILSDEERRVAEFQENYISLLRPPRPAH